MSRSEPLSIEALLQKQKAEKEAASKPKFLTKEQRAALAIARRAAEINEQKSREEAEKKDRQALEQEAERLERASSYGGGGGSYGRGGYSTQGGLDYGNAGRESKYARHDDRERGDRFGRGGRDSKRGGPPPPPPHQKGAYENVPTGPRAERNKGGGGARDMPPPPPSSASTSTSSSSKDVVMSTTPNGGNHGLDGAGENFTPALTNSDLSAIRSRYLGVDKKKRKIRKMNDRKFVFDWDAQDDTGADTSGLGNLGIGSGQGPKVMFGRGHLAGMDDGGGGGSTPAGPRASAHSGKGAVNPTLAGQTVMADALERRKALKQGYDDRHWTEKPLEQMKERDWRIFREDFSISARGGNIPHPLRSWSESPIPQIILDTIESIGYKEPSPIQRQAIPIGLQNRDVIGVAETGSGKTAAFVVPMLAFILGLPIFTDENRHLGPYALILAPTRELAQQIESETKKFAGPLGYRCVSIVGGRSVEEQQFNLREGAEIIIATPGRLKDVLERHVLVLSQCRYIVMDEADRMVNLGFEADLTFILDQLPAGAMEGEEGASITAVDPDSMDVDPVRGNSGGYAPGQNARTRVTTLFSATMPAAVERLARKYLKRPATITIGEAGRAVDTVEQKVEFVNGDEKKKQRMLDILNSGQFASPIIVFVNQKKMADMVAKDLSRAGWSTSTLHSGKTQEQREAALQSLRTGDADILVATDLAGRGIDVQDVTLVINYQMAGSIEAYVHRIGRTGRAGKLGTAITFLTNDDDEVMYDLKQEISKSPVSKVPPELAKHESAQHKVSREMKRKRDADDQG